MAGVSIREANDVRVSPAREAQECGDPVSLTATAMWKRRLPVTSVNGTSATLNETENAFGTFPNTGSTPKEQECHQARDYPSAVLVPHGRVFLLLFLLVLASWINVFGST